MRSRKLAEASPTRIAGFRMTPLARGRMKVDLFGQGGRRVGRPVKLASADVARIWQATHELALDGDAWLALPGIWRAATAGRRGAAAVDAFERAVAEQLQEATE
jgi:hypothetical protein